MNFSGALTLVLFFLTVYKYISTFSKIDGMSSFFIYGVDGQEKDDADQHTEYYRISRRYTIDEKEHGYCKKTCRQRYESGLCAYLFENKRQHERYEYTA